MEDIYIVGAARTPIGKFGGALARMPASDLGALVIRAGGAVRSVPVNHRPRTRGASKYGVFDRLWVGISDLLGVMWLRRRSHRPVVEEG